MLEMGLEPATIVFRCDRCSDAGPALAGGSRKQHAANVLHITQLGRGVVSPHEFIKAFQINGGL